MRQPGPLRAFYERIRARRGANVAAVALARKLACLCWCLLTRGEDYAYGQPSLTQKKLRRLELAAGAEKGKAGGGIWSTNVAMRKAERALARQGEEAYKRTVADWQSTAASRAGADATAGRASRGRRDASSAARHQSQTLRFSSSSTAPRRTVARRRPEIQLLLIFIRRRGAAVSLAMVPAARGRCVVRHRPSATSQTGRRRAGARYARSAETGRPAFEPTPARHGRLLASGLHRLADPHPFRLKAQSEPARLHLPSGTHS